MLCRRGFSDLQEILKSIPGKNLHLFVVWLPTIDSDNRDAAVERTAEFQDPRVSYYWDEIHLTGRSWQKLLALESIAWDVYLIYDSDAEWGESPSQPAFWMHQLSNIKGGGRWDPPQFQKKIEELLLKPR